MASQIRSAFISYSVFLLIAGIVIFVLILLNVGLNLIQTSLGVPVSDLKFFVRTVFSWVLFVTFIPIGIFFAVINIFAPMIFPILNELLNFITGTLNSMQDVIVFPPVKFEAVDVSDAFDSFLDLIEAGKKLLLPDVAS